MIEYGKNFYYVTMAITINIRPGINAKTQSH
jgi:hypothetical protein